MELRFGDYGIRSFKRADVASLVANANNRNVSKFLRESFPFPYTTADAKAWVRFAAGQNPECNFALVERNTAVGGIGLRFFEDVFRTHAEIGYWLGEPFWNKGIVSSALGIFTRYAFDSFAIEKLIAGVSAGNEASGKVLEKNGFRLEATHRRHVIKDGELRDYYIYGLLREELS